MIIVQHASAAWTSEFQPLMSTSAAAGLPSAHPLYDHVELCMKLEAGVNRPGCGEQGAQALSPKPPVVFVPPPEKGLLGDVVVPAAIANEHTVVWRGIPIMCFDVSS
jgi:hypothetical protein